MNPDQHIKDLIGNLHFTIANLQHQLSQANDKIKELEDKKNVEQN